MLGGKIGWPEIVLILIIVLVVFGAGKLPQIGNALGKSIREFKSASKGELTEEEKAAQNKAQDAKTATAKENKA